MARKAQFTRSEPGFSLYEGRTRGKRIKYTFSDEEDGESDALSTRRSNRQSGVSTPAEPARPTVTASGRQVRSRYGGAYGETLPSGQHDQGQESAIVGMDGTEADEGAHPSTVHTGRATRNSGRKIRHRGGDYVSTDGTNDESDVTSSGHEWDGGDDDEADDNAGESRDEEMDEDFSEDELSVDEASRRNRTLVVSLRYSKPNPSPLVGPPSETKPVLENTGFSDQAPPSEANPFATPLGVDSAVPALATGLSSMRHDPAASIGQCQIPQDPPIVPSGETQSTV